MTTKELLELKREQFEEAKKEMDITNMCICADMIEMLEKKLKEVKYEQRD